MFQSKHNFQVLSCLSCVSSELWSSLSSEAGGGGERSLFTDWSGQAELLLLVRLQRAGRALTAIITPPPWPRHTDTHCPIQANTQFRWSFSTTWSLFWLTLITLWPKSLMAPVNDCLLSPGLSGQAGRGPGHAGDPGRLSSVSLVAASWDWPALRACPALVAAGSRGVG